MKKVFGYISLLSFIAYTTSLLLVIGFASIKEDGGYTYSKSGVILNFVFFVIFILSLIIYLVLLLKRKFRPIEVKNNNEQFIDNSLIEKVSNHKIDLMTYIRINLHQNRARIFEFIFSFIITITITLYLAINNMFNQLFYPALILDIILLVVLISLLIIKPLVDFHKQIDNYNLTIYKDRISIGDNSALDDYYFNMCQDIIYTKNSLILTFYYKGKRRIILMKKYVSKDCYQYLSSKLKYIKK